MLAQHRRGARTTRQARNLDDGRDLADSRLGHRTWGAGAEPAAGRGARSEQWAGRRIGGEASRLRSRRRADDSIAAAAARLGIRIGTTQRVAAATTSKHAAVRRAPWRCGELTASGGCHHRPCAAASSRSTLARGKPHRDR